MLSRQAFCGFLFPKLQSHSKADIWETYLTPQTFYIFTPQSAQEVIFVLLARSIYFRHELLLLCCGCVPVGVYSAGTEEDNRRRSTQLKCWRHCQLGGRTGFFPIAESGKGFKLSDEFLLLPSTLNIHACWFICKWRLIHNLYARAMFTAPAQSHLWLFRVDRNSTRNVCIT